MNSEISTEPAGFRPWHFFVLAGTVAATAAVFLSRSASAAQIALVTATIWSAVLAGLALYRTLVPLADADTAAAGPLEGRTRAALENEKNLTLRAIKELEFDRAMGKVSAPDFDDMGGRLRDRALTLLSRLDQAEGRGYRDLIEREVRARVTSDRVERQGGEPFERTAGATGPDRPVVDAGPPTRVAPDVREPAAKALVGCPVCSTRNDADARFCKRCGEPLGGTPRG